MNAPWITAWVNRPRPSGLQRAAQDGRAEIDVARQAFAWVRHLPIGSRPERAIRHLREVIRRREREHFLALELMEEAPLGQSGLLAEVIHRGGLIALGADDPEGCLQELQLGFVPDRLRVSPPIPTGWFVIPTERYGMKENPRRPSVARSETMPRVSAAFSGPGRTSG